MCRTILKHQKHRDEFVAPRPRSRSQLPAVSRTSEGDRMESAQPPDLAHSKFLGNTNSVAHRTQCPRSSWTFNISKGQLQGKVRSLVTKPPFWLSTKEILTSQAQTPLQSQTIQNSGQDVNEAILGNDTPRQVHKQRGGRAWQTTLFFVWLSTTANLASQTRRFLQLRSLRNQVTLSRMSSHTMITKIIS
jgi:hypothetical protein